MGGSRGMDETDPPPDPEKPHPRTVRSLAESIERREVRSILEDGCFTDQGHGIGPGPALVEWVRQHGRLPGKGDDLGYDVRDRVLTPYIEASYAMWIRAGR